MDRSAKLERSLTESGKVALLDNIISISSRFQNNIGVLEQIFLLQMLEMKSRVLILKPINKNF